MAKVGARELELEGLSVRALAFGYERGELMWYGGQGLLHIPQPLVTCKFNSERYKPTRTSTT